MKFKKLKLKIFRKPIYLLSALLAAILIIGVWGYFHARSAYAAPWSPAHSAWMQRQQITVVNNSGSTLDSSTPYQMTINTQALYQASTSNILPSCDDLRVVYQPNNTTATELPRSYALASGSTDCTNSSATQITFPLQASLTNSSSDASYYIYYANPGAPAYSSSTALSSYNINGKAATFVAPFNGITQALAAGSGTPTTATGAIRYSGAKSGIQFNGVYGQDRVVAPYSSSLYSANSLTVELWYKDANNSSHDGPIIQKGTNYLIKRTWATTFCGGGNCVYAYVNGTSYLASDYGDGKNLTDGKWHHIALVLNNGTLTVYVDGVPGSHTASGVVMNSDDSNALGIGAGYNNINNITGLVDEVRISNTARYTSNFTPQTTPFVRDQYTKLLYHFDENGQDPRGATGFIADDSGNGNNGTFYSGGVAATPAYVSGLAGVDSSATNTGKDPSQSYASHQGVFVEEGTTNKITNPSFENSTQYDLGWTAPGSNLTASKNTTAPYYKFGSQSDQLVANANAISGASNMRTININVGDTNTQTLSAYVYNGTSGAVGGTVDATVAKLVFQGVSQTTTYTNMGGGWWRLSYSGAGVASGAEYGVEIQPSKTVYLDGVQLEEKAYATTYADGGLGSNYSWSGTANNSTSSRTRSDIGYSTTNNLQASTGSISLWFKPFINTTNLAWKGIFNANNLNGSMIDMFLLTSTNPYIRFGNNNNLACDLTNITGNPYGKWIHVVATWTGTIRTLYCNDVKHTYNDSISPTIGSSFRIGETSATNNDYAGNSVFSDARIYSSVLSDQDVADLYNTGLASHSEGAQIKNDFPVLNWKFDEGQGTTAQDSSGNNLNGTISGATYSTQTPSSASTFALKFNGTNNYVSKSYWFDSKLDPGTDSFAVSTWFRHTSTAPPTGTSTLITRYSTGGYKLYMNTSGQICFGIDSAATFGPADSACTTGSYADSKWYFAEAVKDSPNNTITLYINGNQVAQKTNITTTGSLSGSSPTFYVGIDSDGTSNPWNGFIDDVKYFGTIRTAAQVKSNYNSFGTLRGVGAALGGGSDTLSSGLVGYWKMDEASWNGTTGEVVDSSGNGNNGTATGATGTSTGSNTTTTLNDTAQAWTVNALANDTITITGGTDSGDTQTISSNTATAVTVSSAWTTTPDATSTYRITPSTVGGKFGNGGSFDGVNDYIQIPNSTSLQNQVFTITAWIKPTSILSLTETIIGWSVGGGPQFRVSNGSLSLTKENIVNVGSGQSISAEVFSHIAVTYDSNGNYVFYINGLPAGSGTNKQTFTFSNLLIGKQQSVEQMYGILDDVRVYNRALSPAEVSDLYNWAPGPVGYWKMDDKVKGASQTIVDSSGNSNNGTIYGTGIDCTKPGKYGGACSFDGTDDGISVPNNNSLRNQAVTIAAWINPSGSADQTIIGSTTGNGGYSLTYRPAAGNILEFQRRNVIIIGQSTGKNLSDAWNYVAVTYDSSGNYKFYINGVAAGSGTNLQTFSWPSTIDLGHYGGGTTSSMNGMIDDVKIYNYARTQKQIVQDMNASHPSVGSPVGSPVGYWKFDEGYGTTANNSGNGGSTLNGIISGAAWTNSGKFGKALSFNGSSSYVDLGTLSSTGGASQLTWSFWTNPTTLAATKCIFCKMDSGNSARSWGITTGTTSSQIQVYIATSSTDSNTYATTPVGALANGQWSHVEAVFDGTQADNASRLKIYINGVPQTLTFTGTIPTTTTTAGTAHIGSSNDGYMFYNGVIDEAKIYTFPMTADEVKIDYNQGKAMQLGNAGNNASYAKNSDAQQYCIPGDTTSCAAPVLEWNFEENSGSTANDTSGNSHTGNLAATGGNTNYYPQWRPGKTGSGLNFDGTYSYVYTPDSSDLEFSQSFTLEAWVKTTAPTNASRLVISKWNLSTGQNYWFGQNSGNFNFGPGSSGPAQTSFSNINDGKWHYVVGVADYGNSLMTLYVDGVAKGTTAYSGVATPGTTQLEVGRSNDATGQVWLGSIDDVKIYNYARTPAQVAYDYNRGGPVAQWKMDECSGTTIHDSSGNNNTGTLIVGASGSQTQAGTCTDGLSTSAWYNGRNGIINSSLNFDGTDDYVDVPNKSWGFNGNASVSAWIYPTNFTGNEIIVDQVYSTTTGLQMLVNSGQVLCTSNTTAIWSNYTFNTNHWYHVTCVLASNRIYTFVNGQQINSYPNNSPITNPTLDTFIGAGNANGAPIIPFPGQIDEVKIYNYALTAEQVKMLYNNGAVSFK